MKQFRVCFELQSQLGYLLIEAESEEDAERRFEYLCPQDVLDMSGMVTEYEVDDIDEVKGDS